MRRLIASFYAWSLGIRITTSEQHVADLEKMLSDLVSARDTIEAEIAETTRRLLAAQDANDGLKHARSMIRRAANPPQNPAWKSQ